VAANASFLLSSARIGHPGVRRFPSDLFLLTAQEDYACVSAPAVPERNFMRRAANVLGAGLRICVRGRQIRRFPGGQNGVKTGETAAVLNRR